MDLATVPDEDLVRRARGGDEAAFRELYARHTAHLWALAHRRLRGAVRRKVSESDVIQDVCLAAFRSLEGFEDRGPGSFRRWLGRILEHKADDQVKRYVKAGKRSVRREHSIDGADVRDVARAPAPSPSAVAARAEESAALKAALSATQGDERTVLALVYEQGLSFAEAGRVLGRSSEAARKLYGRAILRVARTARASEGSPDGP